MVVGKEGGQGGGLSTYRKGTPRREEGDGCVG